MAPWVVDARFDSYTVRHIVRRACRRLALLATGLSWAFVALLPLCGEVCLPSACKHVSGWLRVRRGLVAGVTEACDGLTERCVAHMSGMVAASSVESAGASIHNELRALWVVDAELVAGILLSAYFRLLIFIGL